MQIIKFISTTKLAWVVAAGMLLAALLLVAGPAGIAEAATSKQEACNALGAGSNCATGGGSTVEGAVKGAINILSILVGVAAVIMIIVGGFRYVTSGGDANATKGARDTILYALVGLVVVAIAQAIVKFVLERV